MVGRRRAAGVEVRAGDVAPPSLAALLSVAGSSAVLALDGSNGTNAPPKISPETFNSAQEALRAGVDDLQNGDAQSSVRALTYAAEGGEPLARWKLGSMYATGELVPRDDVLAYKYFEQLVESYNEDDVDRRDIGAISNAFVAVGLYSLNGIPNSDDQAGPGARAGNVPGRGDRFRRSRGAISAGADVSRRRRRSRQGQHARGALAGACRGEGPSRRAGAARPSALHRRRRAAPARARPDVAAGRRERRQVARRTPGSANCTPRISAPPATTIARSRRPISAPAARSRARCRRRACRSPLRARQSGADARRRCGSRGRSAPVGGDSASRLRSKARSIRRRQVERREREAGDAFAPAGEAQPLRRRRLDADASDRDPGDFGDPRAHRLAMRADLRRLADQQSRRDARSSRRARARARPRGQERSTEFGAAPLRVAGREMRADVALAERAVDRVGDRVQRDVGVGMALQLAVVRNEARRPARRRRRARRRGRRSPGRPALRSLGARRRASASRKILHRRHLHIVEIAVEDDGRDGRPRSTTAASSVRSAPAARRCASRMRSKRKACGVCTARRFERSGEATMRPCASTCLIVSVTGVAGTAAP